MIGLPYNDLGCLGPVSEILAAMVHEQHPPLIELADQYPSMAGVIDYIRSLPQRDDLGDPADGPKVHACSPPQRLQIPSDEPKRIGGVRKAKNFGTGIELVQMIAKEAYRAYLAPRPNGKR